MFLRRDRSNYRSPRHRRLFLTFVGLVATVLGGVVLLQPANPFAPAASNAPRATASAPIATAIVPIATAPAGPVGSLPGPPQPRPIAAATLVPTPRVSVMPTLVVRADQSRNAPAWMQSIRDSALRSAPALDAPAFTSVPSSAYLAILEVRAEWALVAYGGDTAGRSPGTAWMLAADLGPTTLAPRWAKNYVPTRLWSGADANAAAFTTLAPWSWLELLGLQDQGRFFVRYPGDASGRRAGVAWVDSADLDPVAAPERWQLPRAYPASAASNVVRLTMPYRSQLDGNRWAGANCGPTTLGMALEALGIAVSSTDLRRQVLDAQHIWDDDAGAFMEALVQVAQERGARVLGFADVDGQLQRWSTADVRRQVLSGRPVIAQVYYRALPERENSDYYGDHYIVINGLIGDNFLYNDSIDSDGVGFDRVMAASELGHAMASASDSEYANAAFALTRGP